MEAGSIILITRPGSASTTSCSFPGCRRDHLHPGACILWAERTQVDRVQLPSIERSALRANHTVTATTSASAAMTATIAMKAAASKSDMSRTQCPESGVQ
jgi:hypothetical protein